MNRIAKMAAAGAALLVLAGCSNGTPPSTGPSPVKPPTGAPATSTPVAQATPGSATPAATGTAAPKAGKDMPDDLDKAKAQKGYDDVKKIGKNPLAADAGAAEKGKALFAANCASCHGAEGNGDGPAGAALDPKPRNLHKAGEFKYGAGDLSVFRTIKYGVDGTGMAPWEGRMTDDECWQVANYVKTLYE